MNQNYDGSCDIYDWKTSKKINLSPFRGKCGILSPTFDVKDCNFIHFSLQLSLYRYILETFYGLKITYTELYHLNGVRVVPYRCYYWKDVIEDMLDYFWDLPPYTPKITTTQSFPGTESIKASAGYQPDFRLSFP